ncbi:MAG: protein-disulfide reductase DsbD domain-containing protein [Opitutaceae bacterium]|jgi:thiol:disulfide interchange protein DsbD
MKISPRSLVCVLGWCALFLAAAFTARAQVTASLVADTQGIQAGHPLQAALRLEHKAGWHTYWINAGTGYPTTLKWNLPVGWTAGEIVWPAPKTITDDAGHVTGQGYDGVIYLPVTLTPPANLSAGDDVTFKARAAWLMCHDACVPGEAPVSLTLPVSATPPALDPVNGPAIAKTLAALPRRNVKVEAAVTVSGRNATLRLTGLPRAADGSVPAWWFFTQNDTVGYDQPQMMRAEADGTLALTLSLAQAMPASGARLQGVLRASASAPTDATAVAAFRIDLPIQPPTVAESPGNADAPAGLLATLPLAFIGGLILNLMPCVFPVLGIKIMGFVNQSGADRKKITMHGLTFAAGVLASFWTLATALAVLRAGGSHLGWGFQLQSPVFVFGLASVMLVFALSMSGVCEFGGSIMGTGAGLQMQSGYRGSFFTGVLATVVATPCSAPFLAPALGVALVMPLVESYLVFTTIAVGLSAPYLLLSIFPQAVRVLPRPGAWMETFKQAMAFPLYATAGYLVWVLAGQTSESGSLMAIFGLTLVAMATWFYGRYAQPGSSGMKRRVGITGALALLAAGAFVGWPHSPKATDIVWETWSPARVAELQAAGRPIYVDFTARWCATCQANKKLVFGSNDVRKRFRDLGVATLRGDWTNRDEAITSELARWNRSAVPFNMVYLPGRAEPVLLPELLAPKIVLGALER